MVNNMNYIIYPTNEKIKVPARGYFTKGDKGTSIQIISSFLASNFMGYEAKTNVKVEAMLGDYFGNNLLTWVKLFQKNNDLEQDGNIGSITLNKMKEYGLNL